MGEIEQGDGGVKQALLVAIFGADESGRLLDVRTSFS